MKPMYLSLMAIALLSLLLINGGCDFKFKTTRLREDLEKVNESIVGFEEKVDTAVDLAKSNCSKTAIDAETRINESNKDLREDVTEQLKNISVNVSIITKNVTELEKRINDTRWWIQNITNTSRVWYNDIERIMEYLNMSS